MSLLDESVPPQTQATLALPLIDEPVDVSLIEDVFTVGLQETTRWRAFIDAKNWDPRQYHDRMLAKRAYHARVAWEASYLLAFTNSAWLSTKMYELIKHNAHFELRRNEFQLISFQLTAGMLGIKVNDHDELYKANVLLFTTLIWLSKKAIDAKKDAPGRMERLKNFSDMNELRPYSSHGKKELAELLDKNIFGLQCFLEGNCFESFTALCGDSFTMELGAKLRRCVVTLDGLLQVTK